MSLRQKLASITPGPARKVVRLVIRGSRRVGYARARYPRPLGTRPNVRLAACAVFKDEASYLAEWVTFHRLMGVDRFYLYDNDSSDDWRKVLAPEIGAGIVRAMAWPGDAVQGGVQGPAYSDCIRRHSRDARWIAFIDIDEFLFSPSGRPLPDVLTEFDRVPAVVVNWRNFGTGGWEHRPKGLVTENYLTRAPDDFAMSRLVKSIVYPRKTSTRVESLPLSPLRPACWGGRRASCFLRPSGSRPPRTCFGSITTTKIGRGASAEARPASASRPVAARG